MQAAKVNPIPTGYRSLTPYLRVRDANAAMDWYRNVLGAQERMRMAGPTGKVMHGELTIGDSILMVSDEFADFGIYGPGRDSGAGVTLYLYVEDVDDVYDKAIAAGAKGVMAPSDQFYGDRCAKMIDPFAHDWALSTRIEDVSDEEVQRRAAKMFGG